MQNLFIQEDDEIVVNFTVATDERGTIFCDINKDILKEGLEIIKIDVDKCEFKEYSAKFKKPSFGNSKDLFDSVFTTADGTNINFNPIEVRYRKIVLLIKEWDLTGETTKPTEEEIYKLHPVIANAIGIQLDIQTGGIFD